MHVAVRGGEDDVRAIAVGVRCLRVQHHDALVAVPLR
jgi:hypothetical protein